MKFKSLIILIVFTLICLLPVGIVFAKEPVPIHWATTTNETSVNLLTSSASASSDKYESYNNYSSNELNESSRLSILLGLIISLLVYNVPIIIYRYGIRKNPCDKPLAKKIATIYGIIGVIIMCFISALTGGAGVAMIAAILLSVVNYYILLSGNASPTQETNSTPIANEDKNTTTTSSNTTRLSEEQIYSIVLDLQELNRADAHKRIASMGVCEQDKHLIEQKYEERG